MSLWKFQLHDSEIISLSFPDLMDRYGKGTHIYYREWFTLHVNSNNITLVIRKGYAWDGCTPKFRIGNRAFGIWDGFFNLKFHQQDLYYASLAHDVLCQFMPQHPFKREDVDLIFLYLAKRDGFIFAYPYYWAIKYLRSVFVCLKERFK